MGRKNAPYKPIYKQPVSKERKLKVFAAVLFWVVFAVFIICLFILNWPKIRTTMQNALWPAWFKSRTPQPPTLAPPLPDPLENESLFYTEPEPPETGTPRQSPASAAPSQPVQPAPPQTAPIQSAPIPSDPPGQAAPPPAPAAPAAPPVTASGNPGQPAVPQEPAGAPRNQGLYFIQIDRSGTILRSKVTRAIPSSDAPLFDALQSLLKGPTGDEQRLGLISLIPEETEILSARVLKDTAYIDVTEAFQYNMYGVEGYAGQLTQVIWTATEFSNVKNVQILIDGRRVDYLGEGIWIGSPVGRDMF